MVCLNRGVKPVGTGPPIPGVRHSHGPGFGVRDMVRVRDRVRVRIGLGLGLGGPWEWQTPGMADRNHKTKSFRLKLPTARLQIIADNGTACTIKISPVGD